MSSMQRQPVAPSANTPSGFLFEQASDKVFELLVQLVEGRNSDTQRQILKEVFGIFKQYPELTHKGSDKRLHHRMVPLYSFLKADVPLEYIQALFQHCPDQCTLFNCFSDRTRSVLFEACELSDEFIVTFLSNKQKEVEQGLYPGHVWCYAQAGPSILKAMDNHKLSLEFVHNLYLGVWHTSVRGDARILGKAAEQGYPQVFRDSFIQHFPVGGELAIHIDRDSQLGEVLSQVQAEMYCRLLDHMKKIDIRRTMDPSTFVYLMNSLASPQSSVEKIFYLDVPFASETERTPILDAFHSFAVNKPNTFIQFLRINTRINEVNDYGLLTSWLNMLDRLSIHIAILEFNDFTFRVEEDGSVIKLSQCRFDASTELEFFHSLVHLSKLTRLIFSGPEVQPTRLATHVSKFLKHPKCKLLELSITKARAASEKEKDVSAIYEALKHNTTMELFKNSTLWYDRYLDMPSTEEEKSECHDMLMKHNTTLLVCPIDDCPRINHYLTLNGAGREQARKGTRRQIVELLNAANTTCSGTDACHKPKKPRVETVENDKLSILYGLLREAPGNWC